MAQMSGKREIAPDTVEKLLLRQYMIKYHELEKKLITHK